MLKLVLTLVVSTLVVSSIGKPLDETKNEKLSLKKNVSEDVGRAGIIETVKSFETDSSAKPAEGLKAEESRSGDTDAKPVSDVDEKRTGKDAAVAEAADENRKDTISTDKEVNESDASKTTKTEAVTEKGDTRSAKTDTSNGDEKKRSSDTEQVKLDDDRKAEEKHLKREADPKNVEDSSERVGDGAQKGTHRSLIGDALFDNEEVYKVNLDLEDLDSESRQSENRASLGPELNLEMTVSKRAENLQERGVESNEQGRSGIESSEVNVEIESSRQNNDGVNDAAAFEKSVLTPELRSGEGEKLVAAEENGTERSGQPEHADKGDAMNSNSIINKEDSASKNANKGVSFADAEVRSGIPAEAAEATETRTADSGSPGEEVKKGVEETRSGHKVAPPNAVSSGKPLETAAEERTGQKSNNLENVKTSRMLSGESINVAGHGRSGLPAAASDFFKEVLSFAGSPAEQSRVAAPPSHTPLGFPTMLPVPMRRSVHKQPSIIISKVPDRDIITLPHQVGAATSFLYPRQVSRQDMEASNEADISKNSYEYEGDERADNSPTGKVEVNVKQKPENLLRVDDYRGDVSNYNLRAHIGSPAANPEVETALHEPIYEHSRRKNYEGHLEENVESSGKSAEELEETRISPESRFQPERYHSDQFRRPNTLSLQLPNLQGSLQDYLPESSLKMESFWPKPLVNRLVQATTLATMPHIPQQNQFSLYYPNAYYPTTRRYY